MTSENEYEPVRVMKEERVSNQLIPKPAFFGPRVRMFLLVALATLASLGHHFFYAALNDRAADGGIFTSLRSTFQVETTDQSLVTTFGNIIARIAATSMSATIGISFVQIFWWYMRSHPRTIQQIDTLLDFKANAFDCLSWSTIPRTFLLALVVVCGTLTEIVSVVTPGSLTVTQSALADPCQVNTVSITAADFTGADSYNGSDVLSFLPNGRALSLVTSVLVSGAYVPPPAACAGCKYSLSFVAPAVQCTNITQFSDMSSLLHVPGEGPDVPVWYAGMADQDTDPFTLIVASRDTPATGVTASFWPDSVPLSSVPVVALSCTGWNATYHVTVRQNTTTDVTVDRVETGAQLQAQPFNFPGGGDPTRTGVEQQVQAAAPAFQSLALWGALIAQLSGNVTVKSEDDHDTANLAPQPLVAWSVLGRGGALGWRWAGDLQLLLPQVMQNISLSLLAAPLADVYVPPTQDTVCTSSRLLFVYERARLWGTYGVGLLLTVACLGCGMAAQRSSGRGETLKFSRILAAYPSSEETQAPVLTLETTVQAQEGGRLGPVYDMESYK